MNAKIKGELFDGWNGSILVFINFMIIDIN